MLKRSLVLGGLVAGAFLLPSVASAVVTGACVNCHTMHNSQNGTSMNGTLTGKPTLLKADCAGCHATATANSNVTGKSTVSPFAPQVNSSSMMDSGGYFRTGALSGTAHAYQHNVSDLSNGSDANLTVAPGGTFATASLSCSSCHAGTGGHHSASGTYYRLLRYNGSPATAVTGTGSATFGVQAGAIPDRTANTYNATTMNGFCGSCHTTFHTTQGAVGNWTRHPTGVAMNTSAAPSITGQSAFAGNDEVPVGSAQEVLCLSCHLPHGGPNPDLLSFNYGGSGSYAGDGNAGTVNGCESCHSYSGTGM